MTTATTSRRIARPALLLAALLVAGSAAFATWWSSTLYGLPDIGDPFDVAAFAEKPIPDDENAFTFYKQAVRQVGQEPPGMTYQWVGAGPAEKAWLERNREALETWRRGTERREALYIPLRSLTVMTPLPVVQELRSFVRLAQLEGSRLEAEGDLEGAWRWYRAMFRSSRHLNRRSSLIGRLVGVAVHSVACKRMSLWANDPRVTPALLRQALDAAIHDFATTSPLSDTMKGEYMAFLKTYDDPDLVRKCLNDADVAGPGKPAWFAREARVFSLARGFKQEPERSRRVTRLIYANLLAICDLPPDRRPPVAATLRGRFGLGLPQSLDLYRLDDSAPTAARALSPEQVDRWFRSTVYAANLMPATVHALWTADRERVTQATLVIALANRLYQVEHGKPPATVEELVGPYLEALPEGYKPLDPRTNP